MAQKNTLPDTARHTTKYFGCCWRFAGISVPISVTLNGYQNTAEHPAKSTKNSRSFRLYDDCTKTAPQLQLRGGSPGKGVMGKGDCKK
jgi:hypothetical protein